MEAELAASLKNLRTDHIDLYQFHNPGPENLDKILAPGGAMEALLEAKAKGVVGHIGITAHLSQTFENALKVDEIETIMFPYNIVEQQGKELIDRCAEKGKAFIDMKPLAGGAIEDGRLALRYVLSNPAVTVSIPGMAAPEELEQNVAGSANTAPLTPEEKAACQKVRDTLGTQFCRTLYFRIKEYPCMKQQPPERTKRLAVIAAAAVILVMVLLIIETFRLLLPGLWTAFSSGDEQALSDYLTSEGRLRSFLTLWFLAFVQVVSLVIPAMPVQLAAGIAYGPWKGFVTSFSASVAANFLVFLLARRLAKSH